MWYCWYRIITVLVFSAFLFSCSTTKYEMTANPIIFNNPITLEQAYAMCKPQAELASMNAKNSYTQSQPTSYKTNCYGGNGYANCNTRPSGNFWTGLSQGLAQGLAANAAFKAAFKACMAEKGYELYEACVENCNEGTTKVNAIESFSSVPIDDSVQIQSTLGTIYLKYDSMMHTEPGFDSPVIGTVEKSSSLLSISETDHWIKVRTSSGKIGWVTKTGIQEQPVKTRTREEIRLVEAGGVYTLPVTVNGVLALNFILDTGASEVVVPADVALTLVRTGTVQKSDFLPGANYTLADGSVVRSPRFMIRSLRIGNREITNVSASIGNVSSYLLMGQNVLGRFGAWGIDNKNKVLVLGTESVDEGRTQSIASLTGEWHGKWNSSRVAARGALGAHLQHSGFALKGQAIITDTNCFARGEVFGTVIGEVVVLRANFGRGQWADLTGTVASDGSSMGGQYIINGGQCEGDVGTWSFKSI